MEKPSISFFFPVYNDENTIRPLTERAIDVLADVASEFEIVIINDGSRDRSGEIADELAAHYSEVSVVHHSTNQGYGRAIRTGFERATRYDWVCFTDGDFQYDPAELYAIAKLLPRYDAIIGFRLQKVYGPLRKFMSAMLNWLVGKLFGTSFRDITCGLKVLHRSVVDDLGLISKSGFIGAELIIRAKIRGFQIGEVAISTYEREFGDSAAVSWRNISTTFTDMLQVRRSIFQNRPRSTPVVKDCSPKQVTEC